MSERGSDEVKLLCNHRNIVFLDLAHGARSRAMDIRCTAPLGIKYEAMEDQVSPPSVELESIIASLIESGPSHPPLPTPSYI
jgi:hypothetical protein